MMSDKGFRASERYSYVTKTVSEALRLPPRETKPLHVGSFGSDPERLLGRNREAPLYFLKIGCVDESYAL